jgi:hypothetical protein
MDGSGRVRYWLGAFPLTLGEQATIIKKRLSSPPSKEKSSIVKE